MKFGLIANLKRTGAHEAINTLIAWCRDNEHELLLGEQLKVVSKGEGHFADHSAIADEVDILVCMGGDGTILAAARSVGKSGTPLLGINLGSLGFLTQQTPQQLTHALEEIVAGRYGIEERMLLKAEIEGHDPLPMPFALNDVVLDNGPVSRVLDINLSINGEDVVTYIADGLVIATPTGSTAYNLAVGGPIVSPKMNAMIASPISPFSLTTRPMIIPGEDQLEVSIVSRENRLAILTLDGQVDIELRNSEKVRISQADFRSRFVVFPENSYYRLLRNKLNWGVPPNF